MSDMVTGVVEKIAGPNKGGYYAIKLADNDVWYGAGKYPPKVKERQTIEFEAIENGDFFNANTKTIKVVGAPSVVPTTATVVTSTKNAKDDYWRRREEADVEDRAYRRAQSLATQNEIRVQASRNAAIEFLGVLLAHNLIEIPPSANKKTSQARATKLTLDKFTQEFYDDTLAINKKVDGPPDSDAEDTDSGKDIF